MNRGTLSFKVLGAELFLEMRSGEVGLQRNLWMKIFKVGKIKELSGKFVGELILADVTQHHSNNCWKKLCL